jgi:S1-C subfamily serine protease
MTGRLVGINTAILSRSGGSNGIGFAIPANLVQSFLDQAAAGETRFQRPWAGVFGQAVDAALAEGMGLDRPEGVVLTEIHPASPFNAAGLKPGDVVVALGGEPVNTPQEMIFRMTSFGIGRTIAVEYLRDGVTAKAQVALLAAPDTPARDPLTVTADVALRGLTVAQINPSVIVELGLPLMARGVAVTAVDDLAVRTGLRAGDVLLAINGRKIETPQDVADAVAEAGRSWSIDAVRDGSLARFRFRM